MNAPAITKQDIDELLRFIPLFNAPGRSFGEWKGFDKEKGLLHMPHFDYDRDVEQFFQLAAQDCWSDYSYIDRDASRMLQDKDFIKRANLNEIKTMLTACVRGERFYEAY
ncbi:MAG TPA: DUF6508 domain-containing protein [Pyrinomonadaceae bacterium]|nr:DUF6508 domain-containing protein [Pyrinomonadaceae bacterium]